MPTVEPLAPHDLPAALPLVLAGPDDSPRRAAESARTFARYLAECELPWDGWRCGPLRAPIGIALAVELPGRTTVLLPAIPGQRAITAEGAREVVREALSVLRARRPHYAQVLADPAAASLAALLEEFAFRRLTRLLYLERDAVYPWVEPPPADVVQWVAYEPARHADFVSVVRATYVNSADCPELNDLRPVEDALAAHRAGGPFDPALWELAVCAGTPAGCLLLTRAVHGEALEVAYMGVVPAARRRGLGAFLLQRALAHCRAAQVPRLALVVDARNAAARRLYARFALSAVGERDAFLLPLG